MYRYKKFETVMSEIPPMKTLKVGALNVKMILGIGSDPVFVVSPSPWIHLLRALI